MQECPQQQATGSPFLDLLSSPETVAVQGHSPECFVWEGREVEVTGTVVMGSSCLLPPVYLCGSAVGGGESQGVRHKGTLSLFGFSLGFPWVLGFPL